jgi:thiol-disulfide isomerase/thioredoxin
MTKSKKTMRVGKIFADWCGHCVALKPEWDNLKSKIQQEIGRSIKDIAVVFVEIGDTEENKIAGKTVDGMISEYNNKHASNLALQGGYPTIFRHCGNKIEYYDGPRTSDELWKWFKSGCDGLSKKNDINSKIINNIGIYNNKIKIKPKSRNNTNRKSATKKHENIVIIGGKTRRRYPNKKAGCGCGAKWFW